MCPAGKKGRRWVSREPESEKQQTPREERVRKRDKGWGKDSQGTRQRRLRRWSRLDKEEVTGRLLCVGSYQPRCLGQRG